MKTLKNIREGFFSNTGVTSAINKTLFIDAIKKMYNRELNGGYYVPVEEHYLASVIKYLEMTDDNDFNDGIGNHPSQKNSVLWYVKSCISKCIVISPEVFGRDIKEIPDWFTTNIKSIKYGTGRNCRIYINNMPELSASAVAKFLDKLFTDNELYALCIQSCPKITSLKGFPTRIGDGGLRFRPDPDTSYTFRDIIKWIPSISGSIDFNRKMVDYSDKILKKQQVKTKTGVSSDRTSDTLTTPKSSTRLVAHVGDKESAPVWKVNDRNKVFNASGDEYGRLTRDYTTVYRMTSKVLFIKDINTLAKSGEVVGYAYNKNDQLVCKLVRE